jgi:hypothetical protein
MSFCAFPTDDSIIDSSWAVCFLRSAEDYPHRVDRRYIFNQRDASNFFISWFLADTPMPYMEMLKNQHLLASIGTTGNSLYKVPALKKIWLEPTSFVNGQVAYHSPNRYHERISYPGRLREELEALNIPHCKTDILRLSSKERNLLQKAQGETVLSTSNMRIFKVDFYELPRTTCAVENKKKFIYEREAPCGKTRRELQTACARIMNIMRKRYLEKKYSECVKLLSAYYHTAINLMPFNNINNSLFMAQVNSIALLCGYSGVEHGSLDSYAMLTSSSAFRELFLFPISLEFKKITSYESAKNFTNAIYIHENQCKFYYVGKLENCFFGGNTRRDGGVKKSARYCTGYKHWIDAALSSGSNLYVCELNGEVTHIKIIEETLIRYLINLSNQKSAVISNSIKLNTSASNIEDNTFNYKINVFNVKINNPLQKILFGFTGELPLILQKRHG